MGRFIDADDSVVEVFMDTLEERFQGLSQLKIKLIYDTKKRIKNGTLILACTELANDKIKYFSKDDLAIEGYDIIIIIDRKAWSLANAKDRKRIMSHELRHVFIDERGKLKLLPHDVSDFRAEQALNTDNPEWGFRLATVVADIYEQEKEMRKETKKENSYD